MGEKLHHHEAAALFVGWLVAVFHKCAIEQADHPVVAGGGYPRATSRGVSGKNQRNPSVLHEREVLWRAGGVFIPVGGEDEVAIGLRDVGNRTHGSAKFGPRGVVMIKTVGRPE